MKLIDMVNRVRDRSRLENSGVNPNALVRGILQDRYEDLCNQLYAQHPEMFTGQYRLALSGVFTPLPSIARSVVWVEDVTGLAADSTGQRVPPASATMIDAGGYGYVLDGDRIALVGRTFEGVELLLYHRRLPETMQGDNAEPLLLEPQHHDAIWKYAVLRLQDLDGRPSDLAIEEARNAEMNLFAAYNLRRPQQMWGGF